MIRQLKYYGRVVGPRGLIGAIRGKVVGRPALLEMKRSDIKLPFVMRVPSSDVATFEQIFIAREYEFDVTRTPGVIVDAGANIGLASIYFTNRFPSTRIIAIEPERSNFEVLERNTASYANVMALRAALWFENASVEVVDTGRGNWGYMTQPVGETEEPYGHALHEARAMTVDALMEEFGIERIDILKIDIEGAEREIFKDASSWIGRVDALIVELHERIKPGCERSFHSGAKGFDDEWLQGENVYLARRSGPLTKRPH